jgi:hypothetical protein
VFSVPTNFSGISGSAISVAKGNDLPSGLLFVNGQFFHEDRIGYRDGRRNPHLEQFFGQLDVIGKCRNRSGMSDCARSFHYGIGRRL